MEYQGIIGDVIQEFDPPRPFYLSKPEPEGYIIALIVVLIAITITGLALVYLIRMKRLNKAAKKD